MKNVAQALLILIFGLWLGSCATQRKKVPPQPSTPAVRKQFDQIQIKLATGANAQALKQLKTIAQKHPNTDIADDANILMGDVYMRNKNYNEAYMAYRTVVDSDIMSPREAEAILGGSKALYMTGKLDEALGLSEKALPITTMSSTTKLELHRLRYQIQNQTGARLDGLLSAVYLSQIEPDKATKENYKVRGQQLLETKLSDDELEKVADNPQYDYLRIQALYLLGSRAFEKRDFGTARDALTKITEGAPTSEYAVRAGEYLRQIEGRRQVNATAIGAVLPMSGKHAGIGRQAMRGLLLGLGIQGTNGRSEFSLVVQDSEDNPDTARRATEKLVLENHVIAIAGGLTSRTAQAVATKANELGVPSVALSQQPGLTEIGDMVFRNALTSQQVVRQLVETAMTKANYKRFAIMYPNDRYGIEYANLFWDEVLARGGTITGAQPYDPKEMDFRGPVQRLIGTYYIEDREAEYNLVFKDWMSKQKNLSARKDPPDDLLPPVLDFDAIFVPDSIKAVAQIAPMFAYTNVKEFKLLGTNLWNNPSFIERGEKYVEGAIMVDGVSESDVGFKNSSFFRQYKATFEEEPTVFAAQAYDVGLMLRQVIAGGETSRSGVRDQLARVGVFTGALGRLQMTERRELTRALNSFQVNQGKIVPY